MTTSSEEDLSQATSWSVKKQHPGDNMVAVIVYCLFRRYVFSKLVLFENYSVLAELRCSLARSICKFLFFLTKFVTSCR